MHKQSRRLNKRLEHRIQNAIGDKNKSKEPRATTTRTHEVCITGIIHVYAEFIFKEMSLQRGMVM